MNIKRHGPYGNKDGEYWAYGLRRGERIQDVIIRHGHIVDGIYLEVTSPDGSSKLHSFGGHGGNHTKITMQPNEHIIQISGMHGVWKHISRHVIGSITIHTNMNPSGYGPYGGAINMDNIKMFVSPASSNNRPIIDFFGTHGGGYLRSIGVGISIDE